MYKLWFYATAAIALSLCGCALTPYQRESAVGAEKLDPTDFAAKTVDDLSNGQARREFLGRVATESQVKCQDFISRLTLEEGNANFYGDSVSTFFSALATVAKPINTVHGLTAGATVASGTKNAYLNGFFAKATIANFADALQRSYNAAITQYLNNMPSLGDDMVVSVEVGKIESIHRMCSLAAAQDVISQTLKPQASSNVSISVDFDPKKLVAGNTSTLEVLLINTSGSSATLKNDMTVSLASPTTKFSLTGLHSSGTCSGPVSIASDGTSFSYPTGAVVPSGNCKITFPIKLDDAGTVTASIKAGALSTDQGTNSADASQTLTFDAVTPKKGKGQPPPAPQTPVAPSPAPPLHTTPQPAPAPPSPPSAQSVPITPRADANRATRACYSTDIHSNPCP